MDLMKAKAIHFDEYCPSLRDAHETLVEISKSANEGEYGLCSVTAALDVFNSLPIPYTAEAERTNDGYVKAILIRYDGFVGRQDYMEIWGVTVPEEE